MTISGSIENMIHNVEDYFLEHCILWKWSFIKTKKIREYRLTVHMDYPLAESIFNRWWILPDVEEIKTFIPMLEKTIIAEIEEFIKQEAKQYGYGVKE